MSGRYMFTQPEINPVRIIKMDNSHLVNKGAIPALEEGEERRKKKPLSHVIKWSSAARAWALLLVCLFCSNENEWLETIVIHVYVYSSHCAWIALYLNCKPRSNLIVIQASDLKPWGQWSLTPALTPQTEPGLALFLNESLKTKNFSLKLYDVYKNFLRLGQIFLRSLPGYYGEFPSIPQC